jgi:hypothetical protein
MATTVAMATAVMVVMVGDGDDGKDGGDGGDGGYGYGYDGENDGVLVEIREVTDRLATEDPFSFRLASSAEFRVVVTYSL